MGRTYTAAIVGCGDIAHHHVRGYQLAGVDVVAVVDPLDVAREQFQKEYGVAQAYGEIEEMLDAIVPDMVSVCTWHLLHPGPTLSRRGGGG